jgi:hypothetical protein
MGQLTRASIVQKYAMFGTFKISEPEDVPMKLRKPNSYPCATRVITERSCHWPFCDNERSRLTTARHCHAPYTQANRCTNPAKRLESLSESQPNGKCWCQTSVNMRCPARTGIVTSTGGAPP